MKKSALWSLLVVVAMSTACAGKSTAARPKKHIKVQGGSIIEGYGLAIDASYDPRLDVLVPGYRIVNAVIVNNSFNIVLLDPERDEWAVRTGSSKKVPAIISLRQKDPRAWEEVPARARERLGYPLAIPIGARMVLDLFVPEEVPLSRLTEVIAKIYSLGVTFQVAVTD